MPPNNGITIIAFDAGRTTGWALYHGETLLRFGQFTVADATDVTARVGYILDGRDGWPRDKAGPLHPALAVVEEHASYYHTSHKGQVGENRIKTSMDINIKCRRRLMAALLRCGIPSLGTTPAEWGAAGYTLADVLAELARAGIPEPEDFRIPAREHQRDAIVMGGRMARRKVWAVR